MHVFRADATNAGDWWSPPFRHFPLRPADWFDILTPERIPNLAEPCLVGGGGLGRENFRAAIRSLVRPDRRYPLIAWGVGADVAIDRSGASVARPADLLGDYFSGFDRVGARVWPAAPTTRWVPCASCMHPGFHLQRRRPATERVGVYQHKRVPVAAPPGIPVDDNDGHDIEAKLTFLARFEFIVTNSYHGVYWATLLGRRVICLPFKSGLFSFRHPPVYVGGWPDDVDFDRAESHPHALEECRAANVAFYADLVADFGDI